MAWYNDAFGLIIIGILLYLAYFVFDIDGKNKGKKQPNILSPIINKLRDFSRWINRQ